MAGLFRSRRRRGGSGSPTDQLDQGPADADAAAGEAADGAPDGSTDDSGVATAEGTLEWVGTDGSDGDPNAATAATAGDRSDPTRASIDGLWEVIRPAAIVPEEAARQVLVELARRDLSNGGVWQSEPQLWSRYDGPVDEEGTRTPALMGTIHVTYGTPTKYEITLYRVTVTAAGVREGWTVASLTDEALGFGGLSLAQCPRATMNAPPRPFTY